MRDWNPVGGDERDYDVPDPVDPLIIYGSGLGGRITKWDARTGQVQDIAPWPVSSYGKRPTLFKYHYLWVTPLVTSRTGTPTLYLGAQVLFASTDRGEHWSVISPDLTGKTEGAQRCGGDVALADAKPCRLWRHLVDRALAAARRGDLGRLRRRPRPCHARRRQELAGRHSAGRGQLGQDLLDRRLAARGRVAYVTVDGLRLDDFQPHVFKTHDGGATWTDISAGLPRDHFVDVVRADTVRPGLLFAGSDTSVSVSIDDGASWRPLQQNLPTAWVRDLLVHGNDLIAGTQGRAIWAIDDLTPLRQLTAETAAEPAHLFTPASAFRVHPNNNKDTPLAPETRQARTRRAGR